MRVLDNRHWTIGDFKERMTTKEWKELLINFQDKIIYKGKITKIIPKDLGAGVIEISKEQNKIDEVC